MKISPLSPALLASAQNLADQVDVPFEAEIALRMEGSTAITLVEHTDDEVAFLAMARFKLTKFGVDRSTAVFEFAISRDSRKNHDKVFDEFMKRLCEAGVEYLVALVPEGYIPSDDWTAAPRGCGIAYQVGEVFHVFDNLVYPVEHDRVVYLHLSGPARRIYLYPAPSNTADADAQRMAYLRQTLVAEELGRYMPQL